MAVARFDSARICRLSALKLFRYGKRFRVFGSSARALGQASGFPVEKHLETNSIRSHSTKSDFADVRVDRAFIYRHRISFDNFRLAQALRFLPRLAHRQLAAFRQYIVAVKRSALYINDVPDFHFIRGGFKKLAGENFYHRLVNSFPRPFHHFICAGSLGILVVQSSKFKVQSSKSKRFSTLDFEL